MYLYLLYAHQCYSSCLRYLTQYLLLPQIQSFQLFFLGDSNMFGGKRRARIFHQMRGHKQFSRDAISKKQTSGELYRTKLNQTKKTPLLKRILRGNKGKRLPVDQKRFKRYYQLPVDMGLMGPANC